MRLWRNRQTRTFEGRMGNHPGSSPGNRTNRERLGPLFFNGYRARLAALLTLSLWQKILSLLVRLPGLCNRWSID